ncbi:VOC family protein [uncultured Roseibium sp.]|uniref:VOC family protein n=1 Tax=uncultured Roseibium sp. TaxID=1936171 RepID=UPI00262D8813|nr:VOC family protein [uncultured Roseibium sp.]
MAGIDTLTLAVVDPEAQRHFYCDVLGMSDQGDGRVGFGSPETGIHFVRADAPYKPQGADLYWKIALSVPNIELAISQLKARGVPCSEPKQFRDVGYLAKAVDPEGFTIELIDHWFQGERPDIPVDRTRLGGGAHLSLVTLRTADISAIEPDLLGWGMTPLSIQPVEPFGFTLYFYAFTDEVPPNADIRAVVNRTWVYQRPYTVLEIQHVDALKSETHPAHLAAGYAGLTIGGLSNNVYLERLRIRG